MTDDRNPRAFPSTAIDPGYGGMSLQDWFAGQALAGIAATFRGPTEVLYSVVAADAYRIADAMLAERERANG